MTRTTPKNSLKKSVVGRRRPPSDPLTVEFPEDTADDAYVGSRLQGLRPARDVLPTIALAEALGAAGIRRLRENAGIAVVVEVPGPDWVPHIELALRSITDFAHICAKTGAARSLDKPTEGNEKVGQLLSDGARVAGISQSPSRHLPATLTASADLYVRIAGPSNRTISRVIRAATGSRPRRLPRNVAAGLGFDTTTACIRLGGTSREAVRRLQAATAAQGGADALGATVPPLETLHGYASAMTWSTNLVRDLDAWRDGRLEWSEISRACLWASEPGLGKSTLARAVAKAARVPLVTVSLGDLFANSDGYLGGVLRASEQMFQRASAQAPAILFIDECDSIPDRSTLDNRAREWWSPLVNFYLTSVDTALSGRDSRVIIIGATNHAGKLDPALIRPGRLHPVIHIPRPDAAGLIGIFRSHLAEDLAAEDLTGIAHLAAGASGADVVGWVKAARATARAAARRMILADLAMAVAPSDTRSEDEVRIVARHEAAHAAAIVHYGIATLGAVSIAMSGSSAGATRGSMPQRHIATRGQIEALAIVSLAGRAMDALGGAPNTGAGGGAGSDLAQATAIVAVMHASQGLGDTLLYRGDLTHIMRALDTDPALRRTVERDLQALYLRACLFVREHRAGIEAVAERLMRDRVVPGPVVEDILRAHPASPASKARRDLDAR